MTLEADLQAGREAQLAGDPWTAVEIFEDLAVREPANHEVRYWLASAKMTAGDPNGAVQAMEDARILHTMPLVAAMEGDPARCRADGVHAGKVAMNLYARGLVAMSAVIRALSLSTGHVDAEGLLYYALALQHQGRVEEAREVFTMAAEKAPTPEIAQFLLFATLFCEDGEARVAEAAKAGGRAGGPRARPPAPPRGREGLGRPVRATDPRAAVRQSAGGGSTAPHRLCGADLREIAASSVHHAAAGEP
jgi:tetratricopeptide (TPR) repeat protein